MNSLCFLTMHIYLGVLSHPRVHHCSSDIHKLSKHQNSSLKRLYSKFLQTCSLSVLQVVKNMQQYAPVALQKAVIMNSLFKGLSLFYLLQIFELGLWFVQRSKGSEQDLLFTSSLPVHNYPCP